MPAVFWGAGAIGGLAGAYAARGGEDVLLVDVDERHVEAMNQGGLRVVGLEEFSLPVRAALPQQVRGPLDLVVLAVKSQHTLEALGQLEPHLGREAAVVSLQNGLNPPLIAGRIGVDRTVGALMGFAGDYLEPGVVRMGSYRRTYIGALQPSARSGARLPEVQRLFSHLCPTVISDNVMGYIWSKLCYCSVTISTALTDEPVADLLSSEIGRRVVHALLAEAVRAADDLGIKLEAFELFDPAAFRPAAGRDAGDAFVEELAGVYRRGQKPHSGMWRDIVVRQRRSETEHLTGALVREAQAAGLAVPLNARLVGQIAEIERGARPRGRRNLEELAELIP